MSDNQIPKLLVATEFPPNASGGGPAVARQMLKDWPVDRLYWWSCSPDQTRHFGQEVKEARCAAIPARLYPNRRFTVLKSWLLENIWARWATAHFKQTLAELSPDVVWVIPHNWSILPISQALSAWKGRYHVTMQDFVDVHGNPQRYGRERCRRMAGQADALYANATTCDATSYPMIAHQLEHTGKPAVQMLHAGLEGADFAFLQQPLERKAGPIRIVYAGTILVENVFTLFVSALERIKASLPNPVELHLCGAHSYASRPWFNGDWMVEHGNLRESELLGKLRECDWGFAPMALTDGDPRYNRYSFPTKFITYLAAGLPVIALGNSSSSVMQMASQYNVGLCSDAAEVNVLAEQLKLALSTPAPRERYRAEILRCAREGFDAAKMRRKLYACFGAE